MTLFSHTPISMARVSALPSAQLPFVPSLNDGILKDPSGIYYIYNITSTGYYVNSTTYQKLLVIPTRCVRKVPAKLVGGMVHLPLNLTALESKSPLYPQPCVVTGTSNSTPTSEAVQPACGGGGAGAPIAYGAKWAGASGGDCSSVSTLGASLVCSGSHGSLGTAGVYTADMTWYASCYSGTSCWTSFWDGLSPASTGEEPLVQNGIAVCVNYATDCPGGFSNGTVAWWAWYEFYPAGPIPAEEQPTYINGTTGEFNLAFSEENQVTFQWTAGSWTWAQTVSSSYPQTDFYLSSGVMESAYGGAMTAFSANPMVGWWETGQWCGCTYSSGYLGLSYPVGVYWLTSNGAPTGNLVAYGQMNTGTSFSVYFGGPL